MIVLCGHLCIYSVKVWDTDNDNVGEVEEVVTLDDEKSITWLEWSEEGDQAVIGPQRTTHLLIALYLGSMLAVGCSSGALHVYLAKLSVVGGVYGTRMAFLSSLLEVTVISGVDSDSDSESCLTIRIDVEPSIIAVGPYHVGQLTSHRFANCNHKLLLLFVAARCRHEQPRLVLRAHGP